MSTVKPIQTRCAALGAAILLALGWATGAWAAAPALTPAPQSLRLASGAPPVRVDDGAVIVVPAGDAEAAWDGRYLQDLVARTRGLRLRVADHAPAGETAILLQRGAGANGDEAYRLAVTPGRITITASGAAGLYYGVVSVWQLLSPDDAARGAVEVPQLAIDDAPRFAWRGLMLDSVRHFQSPAFVERLIDAMALHKLNVLHWHLTDDQGWRIEIRSHPELTRIGAWRTPPGAWAARDIDPATDRPRLYGGFYTQAQVREIVAYAARRHVTIVPEIEMPGHALAAILSDPRLGSDGPPPPAIAGDWGVFPWLYNVDDRTFGVLDDVLAEVMDLFPGRYIHVGGDEAVKVQWKASPTVQAKMKALGITDEDALQSWFTGRVERFIDAHGRRLVGWDEILQGGLPPTATVMSWRGIDGAVAAAKAGHDAILSPAPTLYFDNRQSDALDQPPGRGPVIALHDVYAFDPAPPALRPDERRHILGLQGNIWTEHIRTEDRVEAMAFPRAAAVAEVGWSPQSGRDWSDFARRLPSELARDHALGLRADDAAAQVRVEGAFDAATNSVTATLATEIGQGEIRYTTDGRIPTDASPVYRRPLSLGLPSTLKAAAFLDGRAISPIAERRFDAVSVRRRASQELQLCSNKVALDLESDGPLTGPRPVYLVDVMNPCWTWPQADLTGVTRLDVSVGRVPFNFQLGDDISSIHLRPPATPDGELEVRLDGCTGPPAAVLPLAPATRTLDVSTLAAQLPPTAGKHDLCFTFTASKLDPMWVLNWVQLVPPGAHPPGSS